MIYLDTESCGLVGPTILIQYAKADREGLNGPVNVHEVWYQPVRKTLQLIEDLCNEPKGVCAFNIAFDWFHLTKLYNVLDKLPPNKYPNKIEFAKVLETKPIKWCLKPQRVLDLFLHSRKGQWQTLMDRRPISIRKVPTASSHVLKQILQKYIHFDDIYFRRRKYGYCWDIIIDEENPQFCDIRLTFGASGGLKPLIEEIFKIKTIDFPFKGNWPEEDSFNPYDTRWLNVIDEHIHYWHTNKEARGYAENDIVYLDKLYHYFAEPEFDDIDSQLAICVGACRYKGFAIDEDALELRLKDQLIKSTQAPTAPREAKKYLLEHASSTERIVIKNTNKITLQTLGEWDNEIGKRAKQIEEARKAEKEIDVLRKLQTVKRFCPDFKVIGARSGRMSGGSDEGIIGGSLNPQGINRHKDFRRIFTFADEGYILSGGDYDSFEVTIVHAWAKDRQLDRELRSGQKLQGVLGASLYEEEYDTIINDKSLYNPSKNAMYGMFYGAQEQKVADTTNLPLDKVKVQLDKFWQDHPDYKAARQFVINAFCSMTQPGGIGTEIIWKEPADYVESLNGFRRYFTLENYITKQLFMLAQNPPPELENYGKIIRRKREQTIRGACQSALYSCAFQVQAANMRAAANHIIQATGAKETKILQTNIWALQPLGIYEWIVQPLNIHDEVLVVHKPDVGEDIKHVVENSIEETRKIIPLVGMEWKIGMKDWSEK